MKRSTKYVGLDVHQATTVASVREEGGRVIAHTIVPAEAAPCSSSDAAGQSGGGGTRSARRTAPGEQGGRRRRGLPRPVL
jgi:hypothetical protein